MTQHEDTSYKTIGKALGNITPTMINVLMNKSSLKVKNLMNDTPIDSTGYSVENEQKLNEFINECRNKACIEFINLFVLVNHDIYDFLMKLKRHHYFTDIDLKLVKDDEIELLADIKRIILEDSDLDEVKNILLQDISQDENILSSYQSIVAKIAFPDKKRGRPKKIHNEHIDLLEDDGFYE